MQRNNGADFSVLPSDDNLTVWQKCVKRALLQVQHNPKPYARDDSGGSSQDIYWKESRILQGKGTSMCVGSTFEIFLRAWDMWTVNLPDQHNFTADQCWDTLRAHWFAYFGDEYMNPDGTWMYQKGPTGGLLWLASLPNMQWLKMEEYDDSLPVDVSKFQFGDCFSFQTSENIYSGHSMTFVKNYPNWDNVDGKNVAIVHSSNTGYDNSWLTKNQVAGNGFDWWNYKVTKNGFTRKIFSGGIRNTGFPESDI